MLMTPTETEKNSSAVSIEAAQQLHKDIADALSCTENIASKPSI